MRLFRLQSIIGSITYLLVGVMAAWPRLLNLDQFLTVDEANFWIARSERFLNAMRAGDWLATAISTHPGVMTMWSGALGILIRRPLLEAGILSSLSVAEAIGLMRLPMALIHTCAVLIGYGLLRRMLSPLAAFLAAIFWALDPFVVAYSRLLHVDAPLTTFATLAVLAGIRYWFGARHLPIVLLCGASTGLALLSKSPSLALLPFVASLALLAAAQSPGNLATRARQVARDLLIWATMALVIILLLWPAVWVGPLKIYEQLRVGVEVEAAQPHMLGNFFLGQADDAPGVLFYPVALALRLTPWTLLGVLVLALPPIWRGLSPVERRLVALLAVWVLLLTVALSIFPKKFNRYILPVFPLLDVLAALGIARIAQLLIDRTRKRMARLLSAGTGVALATVACFNMIGWHPYGIAAFNQALGGAQAGREVFAVGWGEGFELVAEWLNQRPDITGVSTVSRIPVVQNPYMRERANAETPKGGVLPDAAGYLVVYVSQIQRSDPSPPFTDFYLHEQPLHVVQIEGVDYAWIYQVPPRSAVATPAWFGDGIQLRGYTISSGMQPGGVLTFELVRALRTQLSTSSAPLMLFAHLIGPDGQRVSQVDLPLPTEGWQPGEYRRMQLPLGVPGELAPGSYRVVLGLYDPQSGARLPLDAALMADPALSGDRALLLATITRE